VTSRSRRHFLARASLILATAATSALWPLRRQPVLAAEAVRRQSSARPVVRFGILTDVHYADKPTTTGTRFYRDSLAKMQVAVAALNERGKADATGLAFGAAIGDLVDSAGATVSDESIARELTYLKTIEAEWAKLGAERHYVLGNHCVDTLTKDEFNGATRARPAPYSFDVPFRGADGTLHVVALDACFTSAGAPYGRKNFDWRDSNIPDSQVEWLAKDLAATRHPVVVLAHQRLDGTGDHHVRNAARVRTVLEGAAPKVLAVLQGHSHQNFIATVNGIPYCVLRAMVEAAGPDNNAFATVELFADLSIAIRGSFRQTTYGALRGASTAPQ
jgi:alkaline phosphatase